MSLSVDGPEKRRGLLKNRPQDRVQNTYMDSGPDALGIRTRTNTQNLNILKLAFKCQQTSFIFVGFILT